MATTTTISQRELKRQADLCLENMPYTIFLANNTTSLTSESTADYWLAAIITGDAAYANVTGTLATGDWNATTLRYELPAVTASFSADPGGTGYNYNTVVIAFDGETYVHSILVESPSVTLAPGQSKTYALTFAQDD
jgi:hypothetical protein